MSNSENSNYVSVKSWMWMIFVWAFTGENESRKNYYRAILAWILILILLIVGLAVLGGLLGNWPAIQQHLHEATHKP